MDNDLSTSLVTADVNICDVQSTNRLLLDLDLSIEYVYLTLHPEPMTSLLVPYVLEYLLIELLVK
jgi:hypothetical protein